MGTGTIFTSAFFKNNRGKLANLLEPDALALLFSNDQMPRNGDQYFPYRQNSDLFYQTGIKQEKTIFMLYPNCPVDRLREVLFIMRPNSALERWEGKKLTKEEASKISGIKTVLYLEDFDAVLREAMYYSEQVYLDTNVFVKFNPDVISRGLRFGKQINKGYPFHRYRRLGILLSQIRSKKQDIEISLIREACNITADAFRKAARVIRPGVKEYEIRAELDHEFIRRGTNGHAFQPIIAAGENATFIHYNSNNSTCKDGDLLLMDFGCEYNYYTSDLTRTVPVNGKYTARQRDVYNSVLKVFNNTKPLFTKGNTIVAIEKEVRCMLEEEMIKLGLFTFEDVKSQNPLNPLVSEYFPHGISHPIGLDVHDPGRKHDPLAKGMVVTLEPGIYIAKEKLGVRIETDLLITDKEPVDLFHDLEIEIKEIEQLMLSK